MAKLSSVVENEDSEMSSRGKNEKSKELEILEDDGENTSKNKNRLSPMNNIKCSTFLGTSPKSQFLR